MILIDNYDSFTYNVVQYFQELGVQPRVFKNDEITISDLKKLKFDSIIISPGAGNPDNAGISIEVIKNFYKSKKILGICLGFQCIAQFFGANIIKAQCPMHGKISKIRVIKNSKLFKSLPKSFDVTRYHSLVVDTKTISSPLKISAEADDGTIMAIEHETLPIYGLQFHPEAFLTQHGHDIFKNFIDIL